MSLPLFERNWLFFKALFILLLTGCASLPDAGPAAGGFNLRGKLGVIQHEESFSGRFLWRQDAQAFVIDLWGPLGQGRVQLDGNPRRLVLREGDGSVISRGAPETVMRRHLGWSLPLAVLPQWVRGQPAPGLPVSDRRFDDQGRLVAFTQLDWQVELERFQRVAGAGAGSAGAVPVADSEAVLPHRITASRGAYRLRLAVSEWQF